MRTPKLVSLVILATSPFVLPGQSGSSSVSLRPTGTRLELAWPTAVTNASQARLYPEYEVQYSRDLNAWSPLGGKVRGNAGSDGVLRLSLEREAGPVFFRVLADEQAPQRTSMLGDGGADVLGYDQRFARELAPIQRLSLDEFLANSPQPDYVAQLTWDPTTAQYWNEVNARYSLNVAELNLFKTNGFLVSERLGTQSFGWSYYSIFTSDLPVFITSDSILQAWHKSYVNMLAEIEEQAMFSMLDTLLSRMAAQLPAAWQAYSTGPLRNSLLDSDHFLTVARSLLAGGQQLPNSLNVAGEPQRVSATLGAIGRLGLEGLPVFGEPARMVDFSQFKVRGHYANSERLQRYFRAMMWCGRLDFRLATFPPNKENDLRQLGAAVVMVHLLNQSGQFNTWAAMEEVTRAFVGVTDSMTFPQLRDLLANCGIGSLAEVPDLATLERLKGRLLTGELGVQSIHSDFFWAPFSRAELVLPRSFTVLGQKFVMDSWAFSQVVFDHIHGADGLPVLRRKPSCLDVAYAVLGNDQVAPEIAARIVNGSGVPFRDGLPYQNNLLALRRVVDAHDASTWTNNIYTAWLAALRALSTPTTDTKYPEAMRTRPWAMKTLNTQMASWTQLRHDTILYVKQSYTDPVLCEYPHGFVEPRPEFWACMRTLADTMAAAISRLELSGAGNILWQQVSFLRGFSQMMTSLQHMAEKELAQQPFTAGETQLLKNVVEVVSDNNPYVPVVRWTGWYPTLFYPTVADPPVCTLWDALVADVHTDLPDPFTGDPGAVIHEAVGNVHLLIIAVDNGPDRRVYVGPVLSHYEFEMPPLQRLTDAEWQSKLSFGQQPPLPEWTRSYLVPR